MNTTEYRNLAEQVLKNKEDILKHFKRDEVLADFGIRIIGTLQEAVELEDIPTEGLEYGDAYAVGTKSPYDYYIWTRADATHPTDYWFNFGEIAIAGPAGPTGPRGLKGEDGISTQWYYIAGGIEDVDPMDYNEGDMVLDSKGDVYRCTKHPVTPRRHWTLVTNIRGPQGANGKPGRTGDRGAQGPQGEKGEKGDVGGFINIVGIVDSEDLLPDPSILDNLTYAYLVGLSNPRELYVQVGENSDTAQWLNTGGFNAATLVTAGGENQNIWDSDVKLNRITQEHDRMVAYVQNSDGIDTWREITSWGLPDSLAMYYQDENGLGLLESPGVPTAPEHVINKEYFDSIVNNIGTGHVRVYTVAKSTDLTAQEQSLFNELKDYALSHDYRMDPEKLIILSAPDNYNNKRLLLPLDAYAQPLSPYTDGYTGVRFTFKYWDGNENPILWFQVKVNTKGTRYDVTSWNENLLSLINQGELQDMIYFPKRFNIPDMPRQERPQDPIDPDEYPEFATMIAVEVAIYKHKQDDENIYYEGYSEDTFYNDGYMFTQFDISNEGNDLYFIQLGYATKYGYRHWAIYYDDYNYEFTMDSFEDISYQRI